MCGILGISGFVDQSVFAGALDLLKHRGPDGKGVWQDTGRMTLGHRRLSILDRSTKASQPMHHKDRYHIVFNGEIYNFIEIRQELKNVGYEFNNDSDTEVILAAFDVWGSECVHKFNGMWAFAIWDSLKQSLFLSRDPMGEKPLFYFYDKGQFGFASEQKALLSFLPLVESSSDFQSMVSNSYDYEASEKSLFRGLKRFPSGHNGWYKTGMFTKKRYWCATQSSEGIPEVYEEQVEMLRELLLDSCRIRLRSDVPIGTGLSGGIDSSSIAACVNKVGKEAVAERRAKNWQNAFVAGFPDTVMDETAAARQIATHLGIDLVQVLSDPSKLSKDLEHNAYMLEEVHEVNPLPHINLYKKMRENDVVVTLDGHGGDELFCGYESSILHALPDAFPSIKRMSGIMSTYRDIHPKSTEFSGIPNYRIPIHLMLARARQLYRVKNDSFMSDVIKNSTSLEKHLFELSYGTVLPTLLRNYDRYSMMSGVEVRSPLLDPRIVKFSAHLPWTSKLRGGYSKAILRDATKSFLPKSIIKNKQKIGFAPPISDWIRGPMKEYLLDEVHSLSFLNASLINPKTLSNELHSIIFASKNKNLYRAEQTWKKFGVYLWEKAFLINKDWQISRSRKETH